MAAIVVFSADWCQPCRELKRHLQHAGLDFDVIDVDSAEGEPLADGYGVQELPTVAARVAGDLWLVAEDDVANLRRIADAAVIDLPEILEQAADLAQLGRMLEGSQHALPRRKADRVQLVLDLLVSGQLAGEDIACHVRRAGLELLAEALDVDVDCDVDELRERVAEALDEVEVHDGDGDVLDDAGVGDDRE